MLLGTLHYSRTKDSNVITMFECCLLTILQSQIFYHVAVSSPILNNVRKFLQLLPGVYVVYNIVRHLYGDLIIPTDLLQMVHLIFDEVLRVA